MVEVGSAMGRAVYSSRYVLILALTWTAAVVVSLGWSHRSTKAGAFEQARAATRGAFYKEQAFWQWVARHGGVYVPLTEQSPASPYLSHIEDRDVVTPSGRVLTLANPSYMTRQVHQVGVAEYGLHGHLTSLTPIRRENAADPWEMRALEAFERGETEISSVETIGSEPYMRLMKPLVAGAHCLKCHAAHGYREGDMLGGISVSASLTPYLATARSQMRPTAAGHACVWLLGLLGLTLSHRRIQTRENARARFETALGDSEERHRTYVDNSPHGIYVVDETGRYSDVNDAACKLTGYSEAELLSMSISDLIAPDSDAQRRGRATFEQLVRTGKMTCDLPIRRKDGSLFEMSITTVKLSEDRYMAFASDITESKRAEEKLQRERRLFMGGPVVVFRWVNAPGWPVEYVSPNVIDLFGHSSEDFITGRVPYADVVHGDDLDRIAAEVAEHSAAGVACFEQEYRINLPGGEVRWLYDFTVLNRDQAGVITHYDGYVLDATERKRAEEQRRQLEEQLRHNQKMEAIGQLAAGVAHEFNNLIAGVLGNAELLLHSREHETPDAFKQPLADIVTSGQRAAKLTRQLLTFSRREVINVAIMDLNQVVSDAERLLRSMIGDHIVLETALAADLKPIQADAGEVEQIIMNLVINARDAMPEGGMLSVRTGEVVIDERQASVHAKAQPGPHAVLSVIDTGSGIPEEHLDRIFEPFFTTKAIGQGTGLGLSTVFAIVGRAGGYIEVDSQPGGGTSFHVYLPQSDGTAIPTVEASSVEACVGGSETILVCDDEDIVGQVIAQLLQSAGYTVLLADSGARALALAASRPGKIALLLTDVAMPEMNGCELAERLGRQYADLRVIYMSGSDPGALKADGSIGAGDVALQKPISRDALLRNVREVMQSPRLP